jgi:twinkle protein
VSVVSKLLLRPTPIEWEKYTLTDDDIASFVNPKDLVGQISDVIHERGARRATLPWNWLHDKVRLPPGEVSLWAGINFHGKSSMLRQCAAHWMRSGEVVCGAFLEEKPEVTMAEFARIAMPDVNLRDSDDYIDIACNWASDKLWLYNQTQMMSTRRILALIAYAAQEKGCTQFILDSLMRTGLAQDDYEGQRVFVNQLTNYAMQLGVHIHLVHHIVKVDESQVPGREAIRGTGAITDQAHHVFIVWRNTNDQKAFDEPDGMLVVGKNRGLPPANWIGKVSLFTHPSGQFLKSKADAPLLFIGPVAAGANA